MSAVYLGRRVAPAPDIPNVVALKIVRHEIAMNDQYLQMFLEEGRLIARLVHPNIVRTLEVGGDAEQDFIAMELMLGKTFSAIQDAVAARQVRLNPEIAAWTAARIADALHYAHELTDDHGRSLALVHRDVNPANVFATFDGEVKLFDFGLAKATAGETKGTPLLAGKLSYLSPEQIMQMPVDRRSDIFSLGTTLWELLTGRRLFRRDTDVETVRAVQLGPIPDPRAVAPELPEELARIARTALERNRDHRYPSIDYLARELDAFVFTRTSPADVTARLAQLVDTLFPGEQKRQQGWLKPAIPSSGSRSMPAVNVGSPSSTGRPSPPEVRRDTRETTAVMAGAPQRPPSRDTMTSATMPEGVAISTPRDGVSALMATRDEIAPTTLDEDDVRTAAAAGMLRDGPQSAVPPGTPFDGVRSSGWPSSPPSRTSRVPPSADPRLPTTGAASWPVPPRASPSVAPPPQRQRPPRAGGLPTSTRTNVHAVAPAPTTRHDERPTDVELDEAFANLEAPLPSAPPRPSGVPNSPPSMAPSSLRSGPLSGPPSVGPPNGRPRPKRAPIPLPSRARDSSPPRTDSSRKAISYPPDSQPTQVDLPSPPKRR
jgi:serine/threonine-protein kinase